MIKLFFREHGMIIKEVDNVQIIPDNEDRISIYKNGKKAFFRVDDRMFTYMEHGLRVDVYLTRISMED